MQLAAAWTTQLPHRPAEAPRRPAGHRSLATDLARHGFVLSRREVRAGRPPVDHVLVAPSGVWVVLHEHVPCERVSVRRHLRGRPTLRVGRQDRDGLIDALDGAARAIRGELFDCPDAPIHGAVCLTGGQFPHLQSLMIDDYLVLSPSQLLDRVDGPGRPLRRTRCREIAATLDARLLRA